MQRAGNYQILPITVDGSGNIVINGSTITSAGYFLATGGGQANPSFAFVNSTGTGMYEFSTNQLGWATNGSNVGKVDGNGAWQVGFLNGTQTHQVYGNWNVSGSGANIAVWRTDQNANTRFILRNSSTGASASSKFTLLAAGDFDITAGGPNAGAQVSLSADSGYTGGMILTVQANASMSLRTQGVERILMSGAGKVTLQTSGTSEVLACHTATTAAGGATATLTNAPAGAAGDPDIWFQLSVNGTTYVIPGWTP